MQLSGFIARRLALGKFKSFASLIIKLAWIGVGLSVAVMMIAIAIVVGYKKEITEKVIGFGGHIEVHAIGSKGTFDYVQFQDSLLIKKQILQFSNVLTVNPIMSRPGIIKAEKDLEGIVFKGVGSNYDFSFLKKNLIRGNVPALGDSMGKREILISKILADKLKIDTGDIVKVYFINEPVRVIPCEILGVYETGLEDNDKVFIVGNIKELQRIFANKQNKITHYEIFTKEFENVAITNQTINNSLPIDLNAESLLDINPQIFDWLGYLDQNIVIILTLMIIVACINMITALLILIIERTNMIGLLKSLGARNQLIKRIFLYHAFYILLLGLLFGNILGIGLCFLQDHYKWIKLTQETYYLSYVPVDLNLKTILFVNIGTIVLCMLALFLPVRMINKIEPIKALKFN